MFVPRPRRSVSDMGLETILSVLASSGGSGGRPTSLEEAATQLQCHMEETVAHDWQLADMARRGMIVSLGVARGREERERLVIGRSQKNDC